MLIEYLFSNPIFFLQVVAILIISICLHELGHGIAAISQGDNTPIEKGHMTLNPIVHMGVHSIIFLVLVGMAWGAMPVNPDRFKNPKWGSILVAAAGPLTNFALGILAIFWIKLSLQTSLGEIISVQFFSLIALFNFALGMFNLLPIPPLDGFGIASELYPPMKSIARSQVGLAIFMILFISGAGRVFFDLSAKLTGFLISL
ncbi:MAG: site-2 protease family protein [Xenococcaceae cyanobacterium MO_167.B27]|nr:site-2 protease family protein [Xenococcaceae cyanobacterium MO_167.B27]